MRRTLAPFVVAVCCWTITITAATVQVPCCSLSTLQAFIANSSDGTIFPLGAGTFTGCPMFDSAIHVAAANHSFSYIGDPAGTTIDCKGSTAAPAVRMTNPRPDVSLTFSNLNFVNGGAGIFCMSDSQPNVHALSMNLTNVSVRNTFGAPALGWASGGTLVVVGSTFTNATNAATTGNLGGAIYISSTSGTVTVRNTLLQNCVAGTGGGMYVTGTSVTCVLSNTTFEFNNATGNGGGLVVNSVNRITVSLAAVSFLSNAAVGNPGIGNGNGGGLYVAGTAASVNFLGCVFQSQRTNNNGAGVHVEGTGHTLGFRNALFTGNSATGYGGGACFLGAQSTMSFNASTITSNSASAATNGGGFYLDATSNSLSVVSTNFTANFGASGAGMEVSGSDFRGRLIVDGCQFIQNIVVSAGPGIFGGKIGYVAVTNTLFTSNAGYHGAAVFLHEVPNATFSNAVFSQNSAYNGGAGGAFMLDGWSSSIVFTNCSFTLNQSPDKGGAFAILDAPDANYNNNLTFINSTFTGNHLYNGIYGAALHLQGTGSNFVFDGVVISSNNGTWSGAAVYSPNTAVGNTFTVRNSLFDSNIGRAWWAESLTAYSFETTTFSNNAIAYIGGAGAGVFLSNALRIRLINSNVIGNTNHFSQGGGFWATVSQSIVIDGCTFASNYADGGGGGAWFNANGHAQVNISNSQFYNQFKSGLAGVNGNYFITNVTFTDNSCPDGSCFGGAMYIAYAPATIRNCTFLRNWACGGGAVYFDQSPGDAVVDQSIFTSNYVFAGCGQGGALYMGSVKGRITRSQFYNTTGLGAIYAVPLASNSLALSISDTVLASNSGAGFFIAGAGNYNLNNVTFYNNTAQPGINGGGGMYVGNVPAGTTVSIANSLFQSNFVLNHGGALTIWSDVLGSNISVINTQFISNNATGNGGAICFNGFNSYLNVIGSTFIGNKAVYGGAIDGRLLSTASWINVQGSQFTSNTAGLDGGAISGPTVGTLMVNSTTFLRNVGTRNGGGIAGAGNGRTVLGGASTFVSNLAKAGLGGALWVDSPNSIFASLDCVFAGNNMTSGNFPLEAYSGVLGCMQISATMTGYFPYNVSGCSGIVGSPCNVECPVNQIQQTGFAGYDAISCPAPQGTLSGSSCVAESFITTSWIANNAVVGTTPRYGTQNQWSPNNLIGSRAAAGVIHSPAYPTLALIVGGVGTNENGTSQTLDDTWVVDTSDYYNTKFTWLYGSKNTADGDRLSDFAGNIMGPRSAPAVWIDQTRAHVFGGAINSSALLGDLWTLNMNTYATAGWKYQAVGSSSTVLNAAPVYGPVGVANATTHPGARTRAITWQMTTKFPRGVFLYGGLSSLGSMADLWLFNTTTRLWAFMGGSQSASASPIYGQQGVLCYANWPGSRQAAGVWVVNDVVYFFGGFTQGSTSSASSPAYNDLWTMTYDIAIAWTWIAGPTGTGQPAVRASPSTFCATCVPRALAYAQFMHSPALADGGINELIAYGGVDAAGPIPASYGELWFVRPGQGSAWVSGHQTGSLSYQWSNPFSFNSSLAYGSPGPRQNGLAWPDHSRPGEFYVLGGRGAPSPALTPLGPQFFRMQTFTSVYGPSGMLQAINGRAISIPIVFAQGSTNATTVTMSRVQVTATLGTGGSMNASTLVNGIVSLTLSFSSLSVYQVVPMTIAISDHVVFTFSVNVTCPNLCYTCTPTFTPPECLFCPGPFIANWAYFDAIGKCQCNVTSGFGRNPAAAGTTTCMKCPPSYGLYITPDADCVACTPIIGCQTNVTCSSASNSRCTQCAVGQYVLSGVFADLCAACSNVCPSGQYQRTPCTTTSDRVCSPCTNCQYVPGTFQAQACLAGGIQNDTVCQACTPIVGCAVTLNCMGGAGDSHCPTCQNGRYLVGAPYGSSDQCKVCDTCPNGTYVASPCTIFSNTICLPCGEACGTCTASGATGHACKTCNVTLGYGWNLARSSCINDCGAGQYMTPGQCEVCTPIDGCTNGPTCVAVNASRCAVCAAGTFLVHRPVNTSDECQECGTCPVGTYQTGFCAGTTDTQCTRCSPGCAACSGLGTDLPICTACNGTKGWGLDLTGQSCVAGCPVGQFMAPGNASIGVSRQCMPCTVGCASCTEEGLDVMDVVSGLPGVCVMCNETAGYLLSGDLTMCVSECALGFYPNTTAEPNFCHSCAGKTCPNGQYRTCTSADDTSCHDCTTGCSQCSGPGLSLLDYCQTCDTAGRMAPSEDGSTCVPCAANCTTCSTSPTTCVGCAAGYDNAPGCAPVCSSAGCVSCLAPEACAICDPTYQGGACMDCSALSQVGSKYPNCPAARQTDATGTGASMGVLALLCILVTVVALLKPLPVFYLGDQLIRLPSQEVPMNIDFIFSTRRLKVALYPPGRIVGATIEGPGLLPGATVFAQTPEKDAYTQSLHLTQKETAVFLNRKLRIEITTDVGAGPVVTRHPLMVPLRFTAANALAIFTIVLDFVQLSSFGFGGGAQWWSSDPVPSSLHYTLIQLPTINNLWFYAYWTLVGLAALWILLVIFLKSGCDAKLSANSSAFRTISGGVYGAIMPLVGQTLYLPTISTMLGALACSRPVTNPDGPFLANFNEGLVCWSGEHWLYVVVSMVILVVYYPLAVYTSPLWQTINEDLDVRYFPAFLVVSGQIKFILSVTSQLFAKIPILLSVLLIVLPLPVVILCIVRPPSIIGSLRWPMAASYMSVAWSGIASLVALNYPDVWYTSVILYSGWVLLLIGSLAAARQHTDDKKKSSGAGGDALRRVLASSNEPATDSSKVAFDDVAAASNEDNTDTAAMLMEVEMATQKPAGEDKGGIAGTGELFY